jgi:hypothetical protein
MKDHQGFATVIFMALIPLLIAAGWGVFFCIGFLKADMATLNVCRSEQLAIMNKVGNDLGKLFDMNTRARNLRLEYQIAEYNLDIATSSGNPYAIAGAEANFLRLQMQREALAFRQNVIIQSANLKLVMGTPQISQSISQEWQKHLSPLAPWLDSSFSVVQLKVPTLAVQPDIPDMAPAYERLPQFEEAQSWVHSWQLQVHGKGWLKKFLTFGGRFQRSCATSLYDENSSWIAKLKKVKSW